MLVNSEMSWEAIEARKGWVSKAVYEREGLGATGSSVPGCGHEQRR